MQRPKEYYVTAIANFLEQLRNREIPFKLDTGAEVTVISKETYKTLGIVRLQAPSKPFIDQLVTRCRC